MNSRNHIIIIIANIKIVLLRCFFFPLFFLFHMPWHKFYLVGLLSVWSTKKGETEAAVVLMDLDITNEQKEKKERNERIIKSAAHTQHLFIIKWKHKSGLTNKKIILLDRPKNMVHDGDSYVHIHIARSWCCATAALLLLRQKKIQSASFFTSSTKNNSSL